MESTEPGCPVRNCPWFLAEARDHRLQDTGPRLTSTQQVIDLIADLEGAGMTWTNVPPLGPGPRSLAEHLEHLE